MYPARTCRGGPTAAGRGGHAETAVLRASAVAECGRIERVVAGKRAQLYLVHPTAILAAGAANRVLRVGPAERMAAGGDGKGLLLPVCFATNASRLFDTIEVKSEKIPTAFRRNFPVEREGGRAGDCSFQPGNLAIANRPALDGRAAEERDACFG